MNPAKTLEQKLTQQENLSTHGGDVDLDPDSEFDSHSKLGEDLDPDVYDDLD